MSEVATHSRPPGSLHGVASGLVVAGVAGLLIGGFALDAHTAWSGALGLLVVPAWLAIGSLVFLAIHLAANAVWITPYRGILAAMGAGSVGALPAFIAIAALGGAMIYSDWWAHGHFHGPTKSAWMNGGRWSLTLAIILAVWAALAWWLARINAAQRPGAEQRDALVRWGVVALIVILPSFTLFAWDALLALQATFVSAMWGLYHLVGATQAALATLILIVLALAARGHARLAERHLLHDLGTWMVAGACVVAYIAFAQYAIIAFANMDEDAQFFKLREQHGYGMIYLAEAVLRLSPFAVLMSQSMRARPAALIAASLLALAGAGLDLAWVIVPAFSPNHMPGVLTWLVQAMTLLGGAGLWLMVVAWRLAQAPVIPPHDPRTAQALDGQHLH